MRTTSTPTCSLLPAMLLGTMLMCPIAWSQDSQSESTATTQQDSNSSSSDSQDPPRTATARQIEEIVVFPLLRRRDLRVRIETAEDNLFARFNELNEDDEFDIVCYRMKRTTSHISRRVCDPRFFLDAESDNASQSAYLIAQGNGGGAYLMSRNELKSYLQPKFVELQQRMEQLTASDGEFRNLTQELLDAMATLQNYGQDE